VARIRIKRDGIQVSASASGRADPSLFVMVSTGATGNTVHTYRMDIDYGKGGADQTEAKTVEIALAQAAQWAREGDWPVACEVLVRVWSADTPYYLDAKESAECTVAVRQSRKYASA
jgi:hypothetical protein